jgi:hypothetical protein
MFEMEWMAGGVPSGSDDVSKFHYRRPWAG